MKKYLSILFIVVALVMAPQVTHAGVLDDLYQQIIQLQQMIIQLIMQQNTQTVVSNSPNTTSISPSVVEDEIVSSHNIYYQPTPPNPNESQFLSPGAEKLAEAGNTLIYQKSEWNTYPTGNKLYRIYAVNLSTGQTTELSVLNYYDTFDSGIILSPDGKKIARVLQNGSVKRIELVSLNNPSAISTIVQNRNFHGVVWSDNSLMIAYATIDDPYRSKPTWQIYFVNLNITPYNSVLVKSYYDMTVQGQIIFKQLTSDGKISMKRLISTN